MTTSLVLGAAHSGRSSHARSLLRRHRSATWLVPDGPDPAPEPPAPGWEVVTTDDLGRALMSARTPVLVDDLDRWLQTEVERGSGPDGDLAAARSRVEGLLVALTHLPYDVVVVSSDLPTTPPGQTHNAALAQLMGEVNLRISRRSTTVHLVAAGRVLDLSRAPLVEAPGAP